MTQTNWQRARTQRTGLPPLWLTLALAALLWAAAGYGLATDRAYDAPDEQIGIAHGQDIVVGFLAPLLVVLAMRARLGSAASHLAWAGVVLFSVYAHLNLLFGFPFNDAFLLYVAIVGLGSYGVLTGLMRIIPSHLAADTPRRLATTTAWVLIVSGLLFTALWLADILPALPGGVPASMRDSNLSKATEALDLAWLLPLAVGTGVALLRRHVAAPAVAVVLVTTLLTLSVAMLAVIVVVVLTGGDPGPSEWAQTAVFAMLTLILSLLARSWYRRFATLPASWLASSVWR